MFQLSLNDRNMTFDHYFQVGCMSIFEGGFEPPCGTGVQEIFCFVSTNGVLGTQLIIKWTLY